MKYFSFSNAICLFSVMYMLFTMLFGSMQAWASTTVTPFSLGGKVPEATPQQDVAPAQESVEKVSPVVKPLFVNQEAAKPKPEASDVTAKPLFVKEGDIKPKAEAPDVASKPLFVNQEEAKSKTDASEASPATVKPLFMKEGDIKPEAEKPSASKVTGGSTVTSFVIPLAPALKKPGKAVFISSTKDAMALTSFTADGQRDTCLRAIALQDSPLVAVRLESMGGKLASWKTKDVKTSAQGVLALYQGESLVNASDAAFSLNVAQPTKLDLCVQDSGALKDAQTKFRIIFFHADGTRTYAVVER